MSLDRDVLIAQARAIGFYPADAERWADEAIAFGDALLALPPLPPDVIAARTPRALDGLLYWLFTSLLSNRQNGWQEIKRLALKQFACALDLRGGDGFPRIHGFTGERAHDGLITLSDEVFAAYLATLPKPTPRPA